MKPTNSASTNPAARSISRYRSEQHFRVAIRRSHEPVHLVDRLVLNVLATQLTGAARLLARMHHGKVNAYVTYVLGTLIVLLVLSVALSK